MASKYIPRQAGTTEQTFQIGAASSVPFTLDATGFTIPHTWVLPDSDGTSGYVLSTDGAGVLSWAAVTAAPGGSDRQVQFNNAGVFGGSPFLTIPSDIYSEVHINYDAYSMATLYVGNAYLVSTSGETQFTSGPTLSFSTSGYLNFTSYGGNVQFLLDDGATPFITFNTHFGTIGLGSGNSSGTSGQVLTSQGSFAEPIWSTPSSSVAPPKYEEAVATAAQTVFNTTMNTTANAAGLVYLSIYVNGLFQQEGATKAYTVTGANQITFNAGLNLNDDVVFYGYY